MVVSDTNILGSFAAADALPNLLAVLVTDAITIPRPLKPRSNPVWHVALHISSSFWIWSRVDVSW
jgi:hypothetical protein